MTASAAFAARHSQDSPEWYTPAPFVDAARELFGGTIDLDPASHEEANRTVRAARFYSEQDNGLAQSWACGSLFVNPPGGKDGDGDSLVPQFWAKFMTELHHIGQAIWIGYSLEQLQTLQNAGTIATPLDFPICVPRQRIAFVENEAKKAARIAKLLEAGKSPNGKSQPSHANYITYYGPNALGFEAVFGRFGKVRIR